MQQSILLRENIHSYLKYREIYKILCQTGGLIHPCCHYVTKKSKYKLNMILVKRCKLVIQFVTIKTLLERHNLFYI